MGPPGSLHITTLHGSIILLGGLTPPDPPLFRTLPIMCRVGRYTLLIRGALMHW